MQKTHLLSYHTYLPKVSVLELKVCYKLKAFFAMPNIQVTSQTAILFLAVGSFSFQTNPVLYITIYVCYQSFILKGLLYIYDQVPSCLFVSPAVLFWEGDKSIGYECCYTHLKHKNQNMLDISKLFARRTISEPLNQWNDFLVTATLFQWL